MPEYTIVDNTDTTLGHVNMTSCNCKHLAHIGKDFNDNRIIYNPLNHSIKECYKPTPTPKCTKKYYTGCNDLSCCFGSHCVNNNCQSNTPPPLPPTPIPPTPPPTPIPPTPAPTPPNCDNLNPIRKKGSSDNLECSNETKNCNNFFDMSGFICKNGTTTCRQGETKIPNKCVYKGWDQLCSLGNPFGSEKCPDCVNPAGDGDCTGCIQYYCSQGNMPCCDVSIVSYCTIRIS